MPKLKIQMRHYEDFSNNMQATVGKILKIDSFFINFPPLCYFNDQIKIQNVATRFKDSHYTNKIDRISLTSIFFDVLIHLWPFPDFFFQVRREMNRFFATSIFHFLSEATRVYFSFRLMDELNCQ